MLDKLFSRNVCVVEKATVVVPLMEVITQTLFYLIQQP